MRPADTLHQNELPEDLFHLQQELTEEYRREQRSEGVPSHLRSQSDKFLQLDLRVENFWDRLRRGYAHDKHFAQPPASYVYDSKLQAYFHDGKLVVPAYDFLRRQIMLWHHVHPWHAHMGQRRTISLVTDSFFWPGITNDIKKFVAQCHSCQTNKSPTVSESVLSPLPVPSACWRIVSLDMITQLPRTSSGLDCLVVFVDQFSKMVRLIPSVSSLDSSGFARLFFANIYPHYGLPLGICSDRGTPWNNKFFQSLCDNLGVDLRLTFSYHPRANGQVERLNRVVEEAVRHFVGPAHDDWDDFIPHIEFSINSSKNDTTGCTPFQLNRITPPLSPSALAFNLAQETRPSSAVMHRMYFHLAKQSLMEAKQSMWTNNASGGSLPVFLPGDLVLLSIRKLAVHHPSLRKKFAPRWVGPCLVLDLVGNTAAQIELPDTLKQLRIHDVFHYSVLKHYVESDSLPFDSDPQPLAPTAAAPDTDQVFEVDAVINFSKSRARADAPARRCPHFLVKWVGFDSSHDMWLPLDGMEHCLDKVAHFLFHNTAAKQREYIIEMFPRQARMHLVELVGRAQRTQLKRAGPSTVPSVPPAAVPTLPPLVLKRPRARTSPRLARSRSRAPPPSAVASALCSTCSVAMPCFLNGDAG